MAGRDIQIPFGPDKTGGLGLSSLAEGGLEGELDDPFAEPPASKYANRTAQQARAVQQIPPITATPGQQTPLSQQDTVAIGDARDAWATPQANGPEPITIINRAAEYEQAHPATALPVRSFGEPTTSLDKHSVPEEPQDVAAKHNDVEQDIQPETAPDPYPAESPNAAIASPGTSGLPASYDDAPLDDDATSDAYHAGGLSDDEALEQGYDEMQMSFLALRDSMGKGRELKAREKELKELQEQVESDREELADREDILLNYQAHIEEQDTIIATHTQTREEHKAELAKIASELQETHEALNRMREYHATQMDPLETELGRARANADQAKNDERSRKSELNAAESEMRRIGSNEDSTMASARLEQVRHSYENAKSKSEQAKDALAEVQRIYDDARTEIEAREAPLKRSIEDMEKREVELKERINDLGEEISIARKRRQYCDAVFQYPDETKKMRVAVEADERALREMEMENDELRNELAQSKQQARKAKLALGIVAVIIIAFVIAIIIVATRG